MILGQLRIWAHQAKNAPLPQVHLTKFDQYKVQVLHKSKRWTQETQKARGADRSASSLDCSLCEDSQSQARCKKVWGLNIIQKKIEYRQIRSDEKKMMILLMVVMMMMLMTMMMTIVAHTYTDWQVGASCVERELPPEATCHLVPRGKKANWTEKAWFRQIWGGFMKRWWSSQSWGCWDLWEKWRSALMTVWKRHKVEVDTSPARVRGSRCRSLFPETHFSCC